MPVGEYRSQPDPHCGLGFTKYYADRNGTYHKDTPYFSAGMQMDESFLMKGWRQTLHRRAPSIATARGNRMSFSKWICCCRSAATDTCQLAVAALAHIRGDHCGIDKPGQAVRDHTALITSVWPRTSKRRADCSGRVGKPVQSADILEICYQNSIGYCGLDRGGPAHFLPSVRKLLRLIIPKIKIRLLLWSLYS